MLCKLSPDGSYSYECENTSVFDYEKYAKGKFAIALGCFDGVHAGHRALIEKTLEGGFTPAVWTFSSPISKPYIDDIPDRLKLLGKLGVKYAFCEDFDGVCKFSPDDFISHLHDDLGAGKLVCGEDFRYGYKRAGDVETLKKSCEKYGMELCVVSGVFMETGGINLKVSSTSIRRYIADGEIENANLMLKRPFTVSGCVSNGKQIGRTIGFPTMNLYFMPERAIPKHGVYFTLCSVDGKRYPSVTNVGVRPTVEKMGGNVSCETFILGQSLDLYGKYAEVEFLHFERGEKKFASLEELSEQIKADVKNAEAFFSGKDV